MASRLSEESFPAIYESGCSGLAFNRSIFDANRFWGRVDLDEVLNSSNPSRVITELTTQSLYYSLLEKGPAECLDVLAHISKEQFLRILDYDVWRRDEFVAQRALYWLDLLRKVSSEKAYEHFRHLEEEYQIGILSPFVRIYDQEAYEKMTDIDQDRLCRFPGEAFFYSIESNDSEIRDSIQGLVECCFPFDMNFTMSVLAHAAFIPPNESVHLLEQFRRARLEEDGFVSYEESLTCFAELDPAQYKRSWQPLAHHVHDLVPMSSSEANSLFMDEVLFYASGNLWDYEKCQSIEQKFINLANHLCAAAQVEADDIHTLKFIFANGKALCSLGLEYLSDGDIKKAVEIVESQFAKDLFRVGISLVRQQQRRLVDALCEFGILGGQDLKKYFILQKYALTLDWFDNFRETAGFEQSEILKGLFNRFPQFAKNITDSSGLDRVDFFPIARISELKMIEELINRIVLCLQIDTHQS